MHHWPIIPSTGTREISYPCNNNSTHWSYTWTAGGTADYSIEYTHNNSATITDSWSAGY